MIMKASDVMSVNVIAARPDQSIEEVAMVMLSKGISGLPVIDNLGRLIGIVSEGDLIRRAESGTTHRRSWWLHLLMGRDALAQEYIKENSRRVEDVMTRQVITASPTTPLVTIAELLERHRVKRVPIISDGKLIGIVSRANVLQAVASASRFEHAFAKNDTDLREAILEKIRNEPWGQTCLLNVTVTDGAADLWGVAESEAQKKAFRIAAEITPGVRAVNDNVIVRRLANSV